MKSAYSLSIDAARDTIVQRARQYKWLVMGLSIVGLTSAAVALVIGSFWPLLVGLGVPSAVTGFFALDLREVQRWRRAALAAWADGELQLDLLASTLKQVPNLPELTTLGMLETLPTWHGTAVQLSARPTLVRAQDTLAGVALQALIVRAVAWAAAAAAAAAAIALGTPQWLTGGLAAPALWFAWRPLARERVRRSRLHVLQACRDLATDTGPDDAAVGVWLNGLNWQGVPPSLVAEWRAARGH
jgi:hypothetical protein